MSTLRPIRAVIVDDEPLGREGVRLRLAREPRVEVIGEFGNALHAANALPDLSPDVVFLDVQMPGLDAFGIMAQLPTDRRPDVILVTAHAEYAVRAFDQHVDDYLLKPLDDARFRAAIERLRHRRQLRDEADLGRRTLARQRDEGEVPFLSRVPILHDGRIVLLPVRDVLWIEAAGDYVRFYVAGRSFLHRATMSELIGQLDPAQFARTHRSHIVNLAAVCQIEPDTHGECRLVLRDGARVKVSRSYRHLVDAALGIGSPLALRESPRGGE